MEFGVSTWLWHSPFSAETLKLFPLIKKMGYDCVEIPVEDPDALNLSDIKKALADNGLSVTVCGAFGPGRDLSHEDNSIVENTLGYISKCLDICNEFGVAFYAGPMYAEVGKARMLSPEERQKEWGRAASNVRKACELADARNLNLAIEPLNRFESDMINTTEDVVRLIKDIDHKRAKICLDGFHMSIEERDLCKAIQTAGDLLQHLQVSENYRGIPGTGSTDWEGIKKGLESINYNGKVVIESFTPHNQNLAAAVCIWKPFASSQDEFAQKGLDFLKKLFAGSSVGSQSMARV